MGNLFMKPAGVFFTVILGSGLFLAGCSPKHEAVYASMKDTAAASQLKQFVLQKLAQANAATNETTPDLTAFFAAAQTGDWLAISNQFQRLRLHAGQFERVGKASPDERLRGPRWEAAKEIWGAFDAFGEGGEYYSAAFGRDIIAAIPPGSIYFGGTDPGRFVVTALCPSQVAGDPFFVLTQNALADTTYLNYLRGMYGAMISLPTDQVVQNCFQQYTEDAEQRRQNHQLKPGEDVQSGADGRLQVSGQVAVMSINGLIVKAIMHQNPKREFYIEESFPFDWMYPQLEPHGLIFKLDRQPLASLPEEIVQADHTYWANYARPMIGDWLKDDTSVAAVAAFAEKTFGRQDFGGFNGDRHFVQNAFAHTAFSKLRSSIGGLYDWRAQHAAGAADQQRMIQEADFAYRQAWALCPYSPEAVYKYASFLLEQKRVNDALLVAETSAKIPPQNGVDNSQMRALADQIKKFQGK
jgi:hypothetical protein